MATDALMLEPVRDALAELVDRRALVRLYERDASLWSVDGGAQDAIADRLGWLDVAAGNADWSQRLREFAGSVRADGLDRVVLAGMGGSSLAPEVFASVHRRSSFSVLDSTHPTAVGQALDAELLAASLAVVSSKSGTTTETRAFAAQAGSLVDPARQLVAVTDEGSSLADHASEHGWRAVFTNPSDIGGRYSALSLFGMLPAALIGVDIDAVWQRGEEELRRCRQGKGADNSALALAAFAGGLARAGRDKLTVIAPATLAPLGDWIEQLVAESTGKDGTGVVPVVGEPVGEPDAYGDDRAFVDLRLAGESASGVEALAAAGHPVLRIDLTDLDDLGAQYVRWELATALIGLLLGVNPFDEPNVAESKANTEQVLDALTSGALLPEPVNDDVAALISALGPRDYLSIQCYLAPDRGVADQLTRIRTAVRDTRRVATTFGWGPRFLHSTGQLHKGGPDSVVALQLVDTPPPGHSIPGRDYDFATLIRAQAAGDVRSLRDHGRRVAQATVDNADDLARLIADVEDGLLST